MTSPKPESVTWKWVAGIFALLIGSLLSIGVALLVGVLSEMRTDINATKLDVAVIKAKLSPHVDAAAPKGAIE